MAKIESVPIDEFSDTDLTTGEVQQIIMEHPDILGGGTPITKEDFDAMSNEELQGLGEGFHFAMGSRVTEGDSEYVHGARTNDDGRVTRQDIDVDYPIYPFDHVVVHK